MHIGFVTPEYATPLKKEGGLANYIRKSAGQLTKRGHHVSVFFLSNRSSYWLDGDIQIYEIKALRIHRRLANLKYIGFALRIYAQLISARRVARKVFEVHARQPIDILQTSNYRAPAYCLLNNQRIPLVCRLSSYSPILRATNGMTRNFQSYLTDWFEVRQAVDAEAVFAPSRYLALTFERTEGVPVRVIRTPLEEISSKEWNTEFYDSHLCDRDYLLFVGIMNKRKGADIIAEISYRLLQQYPDLHLVLIGRNDSYTGERRTLDYVYEQIGDCADRLLYSPPIDKQSLYPVYARAIGLLMPSRDDNFPNVCLEAQSLEVPVVGTNNSSLEEMIVDGETGFLAENGDPEDFLAAVHRLMAQSSRQREEMRANIRELNLRRRQADEIGTLLAFYNETITGYRTDKE